MNVYYNSNFGCLVCPETRMGNTPMRVVIDPVAILNSGFTATALGEALLNALERSRTAPPVPRVNLGAGRFWQVTGIKGFAAFSRKFHCVSMDTRGPVLERWQEQYGILSEFRFQHRRKLPLMASMRGRTAEAEVISHV